MQTFLPYPNFRKSAEALDPKRLGNQAYRECKTLINGGWPNHPCAKMWRNHKPYLAFYALCCLEELSNRGRQYPHHVEFFRSFLNEKLVKPFWIGDERIHSSHRAILLAKDYKWYSQFNWKEKPAEKKEEVKK